MNEELRKRVKRLYREYEVIYITINAMTKDISANISKTRNRLDSLVKKQLLLLERELTEEILSLRKEYGIKVPNSALVKLVEKFEKSEKSENLVPLISKSDIKTLFSKYDKVLSNFDIFPEHARIEIDIGKFREDQGSVEVYILEASLFENMCALFNLAKERYLTINRLKDSKMSLKTTGSLIQATVVMAFNFLEAYLNGIAYDFFILNETSLDESSKMFLIEWDTKRNCNKYVSLREKILHYPKIISRTQHPPIQESNCPEMKFILTFAKVVRDSIVHASPIPNPETFESPKLIEFFRLDIDDAEKIVDNIIELVLKIEIQICGGTDRLFWISKREGDYFPEAVFS